MNSMYKFSLFLGSLVLYCLFIGYVNGPGATIDRSFTGAPGEDGNKCGNCHNVPGSYGGVTTTIQVLDTLTGAPITTYNAGETYDVVVTVNHGVGNPSGFGFQCVAVDPYGFQLGTFLNPSANTKITQLTSGNQVAEHDGLTTTGPSNVFSWQWNAPYFLQNTLDITFYSTGAAVNGNNAISGDSGSGLPGTITLTGPLLPVELIDFTVSNVDNRYHLLEWSTASELNADYFIIEHSLDGESFSPIAKQTAAGTTHERQDYDFRLTEPKPGTNYYRLTQVDFDGQSQTFNIVSVYQFEALELVKLYPIPVMTTANLEIQYTEADFFNLEVHDQSGKTVKQQAVELKAGLNTITLDLKELVSGSYIVKLSNSKALITATVLKF